MSALLACLAIAAAVAWWRAGSSASLPSMPPPTSVAKPHATSTTTAATDRLVVHVVGAVARPGVLELRSGARVVDAIKAAGGASPAADLARLNLAAPLTDGERIAVPSADGEAPPLDPGAVTGGAPGPGGTSTPGAPVNINTATAEQLDALPGVGPATAAAIVADRDANGPFATVDDLSRVRGIGPAKLEQLRDLVAL